MAREFSRLTERVGTGRAASRLSTGMRTNRIDWRGMRPFIHNATNNGTPAATSDVLCKCVPEPLLNRTSIPLRGRSMDIARSYVRLMERYRQAKTPEKYFRSRGDVQEWWESVLVNMSKSTTDQRSVRRWESMPFDSRAQTPSGITSAFVQRWEDWKPLLNAAIEGLELDYAGELAMDEIPAEDGTEEDLKPSEGSPAGFGAGFRSSEVKGLRDTYYVIRREPFNPQSDRYFLVTFHKSREGPGYLYWTSRTLLDKAKDLLRPLGEFRPSDPQTRRAIASISRFAELGTYDAAKAKAEGLGYPILFDLLKLCYTLAGLGEAAYARRLESGHWRIYFRVT